MDIWAIDFDLYFKVSFIISVRPSGVAGILAAWHLSCEPVIGHRTADSSRLEVHVCTEGSVA